MILISYILAFLALALLIVVFVFNFFFVHLEDVSVRGYFRAMGKKQFWLAKEIDIFGNYAFADLWNWLFRKKGGYGYGRKGETISSATGKNQRDRTASITGWGLIVVLFIADTRWVYSKSYWKAGGHCMISIQTEDEINNWAK